MKVCFNTEKGPKAVGPYSTLTMTNDLVFVSGMIPLDPNTNEIVEGGIEAQARQALENIKTVLGEVNLTMNHALKTTVLLTDLSSFGAVNAIYGEYFGPDFPARACYEVSRLPKGAMIEIEVIAARTLE
ncbi:MAG: reactive intermediate/imine deaminase [Clostridia bacterium]|nr:reactive intermediate/imine deaminase [Clostridia bacterium]MBQ2433753.1 reactive intermediate/imine deaminase [Clostridia bacterium]MBQ5770729.1 reactive intermediate/imine deaminase [Clostridia bacterium]